MGLTFHCQLCQYCFSFVQRSAIHLIFYRRGWFPVSILVFYNSSISKLSITFYRYIFTVLNDFTFLRRVFFLKIFLHGDILMIWYCLSRVCLKIFLFYETSILFWAVENQNWTFTFFTLLTISYINESSYWCIHLFMFLESLSLYLHNKPLLLVALLRSFDLFLPKIKFGYLLVISHIFSHS